MHTPSPALRERLRGLPFLLAVVLLLVPASVLAEELPRFHPLLPLSPGQDPEDMAEGIDLFYAATETVSLTFIPATPLNDERERLQAAMVELTLDAALLAEIEHDRGNVREDLPDILDPLTVTLDPPGKAWLIEESYDVPMEPAFILTTSLGADEKAFVLVELDPVKGVVMHEPLPVEVTVGAGDVDWAWPWYPVAIAPEIWPSFITERTASTRLIHRQLPPAWRPFFPQEAALSWGTPWWRDLVWPVHEGMITSAALSAHMSETLLAAMIEAGDHVADAAESLDLLRRLVQGPFLTPDPAAIAGTWQARTHSAVGDGQVFISPWFEADISALVTDVKHEVVLRATTGSRRVAGRLLPTRGPGLAFLGGIAVNEGPELSYSALDGAESPRPSDTAGAFHLTAPDKALLLLNADGMVWELYELQR